ncbi:TetR/AcrR family transcriptional regulator [Stackebrandtia nassauensis]|uniref:Transcriptional regulator, TetR family n=1 Tax=Stackebrandtia nassauensis (strain DSM 44728 / CIP 108903 / NRRL B-16338 / NBRC 102104 / LLR-40K-21) TaxID=446470 RepID=D3PU23_STANL|nr:TetR/AcrR family transcriptional regulator [Stackebrandtia nassauensis]ADD40969.1 transcriptional regulator, TetR family [Stackebrandtia nassauensis DSM 44728]
MTATKPRKAGRPRKEEATDTRTVLLDAALKLFVAKGFAATSVRMIARAAGLSDGGLYAHFPSKQAVYDELLASAGPGVVDGMVAELLPEAGTPPQDPETFLTQLVGRILDYFETPAARDFSLLLLREEIPGNGDLVTAMIDKGAAALGPVVTEWAKAGHLPDRVRQRLDAGTVTGESLMWELLAPLGFVRLVYLHGTDESRAEGRRRADAHLEFFLNAVVRD